VAKNDDDDVSIHRRRPTPAIKAAATGRGGPGACGPRPGASRPRHYEFPTPARVS